MKKQRLFNNILLIVFILSSCAKNVTESVTPISNASPDHTSTPSPIPPSPTATPTSTPTLPPTATTLPSPTPRPEVDRTFITSLNSQCDEAFKKRVSGGLPPLPVVSMKEYDGEWFASDYKVPFAETTFIEDIRSLICILPQELERGTYTDGAKAYQTRWKVRILDYQTGQVYAENGFVGDNPPNVKMGHGNAYGSDPSPQDISTWLFKIFKLPVYSFGTSISSLAFSPDGQYLAVGAGCHDTRLINLKTSQFVKVSTTTDPGCYMNYRIDFSPSGSILSFVDDGYLTYKVFSGKFTAPDINSTGLQSELYTDFSSDGQFIVIGGAVNKGKDAEGNWNGTKPQGTLYIYDAATAQEKLMIAREVDLDEFRYRSVLDNLTFSPDGKFLASLGMGELMIHSPRDGLVLFSTNTGHITEDNNLKDLGLGPSTIDRSATGLAVSPDSRLVAVGTAEGGILVLDSSDWIEVAKLSGHDRLVRSVAFSPDGRYLASGGEDHLIILWNTADWSVAAKYTGHIGEITAVAFTVDGKNLASGSGDRTVYLWDLPE